MSNAVPSRIGQTNQAGAVDALFLKLFGGMVLAKFDVMNVMMDKHQVRTIPHGKSAKFDALGATTAGYHTAGAEVLGDAVNHAERVINIDGKLYAAKFVDELDDLMNHFDVQDKYAHKNAEAISNQFDKNVLQTTVLAARAAATVTDGDGGTKLQNVLFRTDSDVLADGIYDAAQVLDEKNVPEGDTRWCALRPAQYYLLAQNTKVLNKDWNGAGSYSDGKIIRIAGVVIVKTNHLPITNISQVTGTNNTYHGDFSDTAGVVWQSEAVGTVKLKDIVSEITYDARRFGHLMTSRNAVGHGILRPECAVELSITAP